MLMSTAVQGNLVIVDDNLGNLDVLQSILEARGHVVRATHKATDALKMIQQTPPELILLDAQMPIMSGYQVCEALKQDPQTAPIPVIFVSAETDIHAKLSAFNVGAVDHISKPYEAAEVLARVNTHLTLYRQHREIQALNRSAEARQKALERSEARLRSVLENVHDLIITFDERGSLHYANPYWHEVLGYQSAAQIHISLDDFVEPNDLHKLQACVQSLLNSPHAVELLEVNFRTQDGHSVLLEGNLSVTAQKHGHFMVRGIFRDITQRRRLERRTLRMLAEQEKVRALSEFIDDTSHELRTPLAIMDSTLYLMTKTGELSETVQKRVGILREQVKHLTHLIEQMQFMSSLSTSVPMNKSLQSPAQLVAWAIGDLTTLAEAQQLTLTQEIPPDLPKLYADAELIAVALTNLLHNAILYTPRGGHVYIGVLADLNNQQLRFYVRDTGIGIAPAEQTRIFERFYKVNRARTSDGSGMGLGLAMVRKIADLHDGEISVQSALGGGSTFTLRLPLSPTA